MSPSAVWCVCCTRVRRGNAPVRTPEFVGCRTVSAGEALPSRVSRIPAQNGGGAGHALCLGKSRSQQPRPALATARVRNRSPGFRTAHWHPDRSGKRRISVCAGERWSILAGGLTQRLDARAVRRYSLVPAGPSSAGIPGPCVGARVACAGIRPFGGPEPFRIYPALERCPGIAVEPPHG